MIVSSLRVPKVSIVANTMLSLLRPVMTTMARKLERTTHRMDSVGLIRSSHYPNSNSYSADDFFVFENPPKTYPKNIPISSLTPESDFIKDILVPSDGVRTKKTPPLVELSSDKSGLRLAFETNRQYTSLSLNLD